MFSFSFLYLYSIAAQGTIIQNANKKNMPPNSPGSISLLMNIFITVRMTSNEIKITGNALDRFI